MRKHLPGKHTAALSPKRRTRAGFSLIELIVVIMLTGLIAAILAPFAGPALTGSHKPLDNLDHAGDLGAEMAKVVAQYRSDPPDTVSAMDTFQNAITSTIIDDTVVTVAANERVRFAESGGSYSESACSDPSSLDCVLKVRLRSLANPGETTSYYFPYKR
ncbi:MAG TPA: prepilin-type N-terminal cleavage/methylation domain-containing protein, partial [Desulfosalsimonadaceae bacterium]|nr:prepilin-type N-terminal cleavage/methylation domain-containing protein [Desulfosalsimonadaceae bacterium]